MPDDRRFNRRNFFRNGLRELLRPAVDSVEEKLKELADLVPQPQPEPGPPRPAFSLAFLRPPGAIAEPDFLSTCSRCGACVAACPANAIVINERLADGAPFIDPNAAACVACSSLACMMSCPTGALEPTPLSRIDMGLARWDPNTCLRTNGGGDCEICVEVCPIGEVAIRTSGQSVEVLADGCIGCGLCQNKCPTKPKSIVVEPNAYRGATA